MTKPVSIYGIKNCDTMKKARAWLDANSVPYVFHDYKSLGIDRPRLEAWVKAVGWEQVINRAGTTFRKLAEQDRAGLDENRAIGLMLTQPAMIRRPVMEHAGRVYVGFRPAEYVVALT